MPDNKFLDAALGEDVESLDEVQNANQNPNQNDEDADDLLLGSEESDNNIPSSTNGGNSNENEEAPSEDDLESSSALYREVLDNLLTDNPDEESVSLKNDLLKKFKGNSLDNDGNVLNENGEIVASFEEVSQELAKDASEEILDEQGNLLDEEGNIIKTAVELKAENIEANKIAKNLGYSFKDEEGNDKLYSKGDKGVQELALDIAQVENEKFKNSFINSNPVLREVAKHLLAGHDLDTFNKPVDYTNIDVKNLSAEQKRDYIKKSFLAEGVSFERAVKLATNSKLTDEEVNESLQILTSKEKEAEKKREEDLKNKQKEEEDENIKYWNTVEDTIKKGTIAGIKIPETEQTKFFEYLSKPVEGQYSEDYIKRQKQTTEERLKEAYFRYKGYNLEDIIKEETQKNRILSLRQRMAKIKKSSSNSSSSATGNKKNAGEITVDRLL